jgi:hypothetical protein
LKQEEKGKCFSDELFLDEGVLLSKAPRPHPLNLTIAFLREKDDEKSLVCLPHQIPFLPPRISLFPPSSAVTINPDPWLYFIFSFFGSSNTPSLLVFLLRAF